MWPELWDLVLLSVWEARSMRLCVCDRGRRRLEVWNEGVKPACLWHLPWPSTGTELDFVRTQSLLTVHLTQGLKEHRGVATNEIQDRLPSSSCLPLLSCPVRAVNL